MAEQNYGEQLDRFVDAVVATPRAALPNTDAELASLARIAAGLRGLPREDFKERLKADLIRRASMATGAAVKAEKAASTEQTGTTKQGSLPSGYPTITPYLIVNRASDFIEFLKSAFGGVERFRFPIKDRPDLLMHAEVAVGNSIIELADATEKFAAAPQTLHLYVPDAVDAVYARAIAAGATAVHPPQDQHWGDRMGTLRDAFGNVWYIATPKGWTPGPEGLRSIQPYLHVRGATKMISFLEEAFGADAQGVAKSPEGQVFHSTIQIGDWSLEVDDASEHAGEPMPCHLHLHVPNADALYARAMQAGATSIEAPSDKPYGRSGGVRDAFGNSWYITTSPAQAQQVGQPETQAGAAARSQDSSKDARISQQPIAAETARASVSVSPRLTFKDAAKAIEFYERALGARETFRFEAGGRIAHAEIAIGDSIIDVAEEWPEGGRFSAETLGNSPVWMSLEVDDVDTFAQRAVDAGMKVKRPIQDQFYGHRDVLLTDPFGYNWGVYTVKEEMSVEEMHRRMKGLTTGPEGGKLPNESRPAPRVSAVPRGFRTVQPYLVAADGPALLDFVRNVFDADETCRILGPRGVHGETRIGDTTIMLGGGVAGQGFSEKLHQGALHVYVQDTDAVYAKALAAGATSVGEPQDHEYGERGAGVKDPAGNLWYIATHKGESYIPQGLHNVNVYMHPLRAEPVIRFMKTAFGAEEIARYASPDGVVHHAQVRITDSVIEMGEAHGPYQPMESMFYLYVPDADAVYQRALAAGAKTLHEPKDQNYGDRNAAVTDAFGNTWYIATHIRERQPE